MTDLPTSNKMSCGVEKWEQEIATDQYVGYIRNHHFNNIHAKNIYDPEVCPSTRKAAL